MEECDVIPCYFITVKPNDVLLGRGAPIINNEGNVRFRNIVAERKDEYKASSRHQLKNAIAKDIIDEVIQKRNGRFLRMADDIEELKQKGHIPIDAKSAWVVADNIVILNKVKQALRELDENPMSTTSSNKKKRKNTNSSTATSSTITSTSKRKFIEVKEEQEDIIIEESINDKPKKVETQNNHNTIAIRRELSSSQNHWEGYERNTADTLTSLTLSLNQHDRKHSIQLEASHKMPPISKNIHSKRILMFHEQKNQQSLSLDQPNIRSNILREVDMMPDPIHDSRRIELRKQEPSLLHQIPIRQSELCHDKTMNIKNVLQDDQPNEPLQEQNQHMFVLPKVLDENFTNSDMKAMHQIDNFQRRMTSLSDQSHDLMAMKQQSQLDQNSLVSADQSFFFRQRLLHVQQDQERKTMLLYHQLEQQQKHQQLLQLEQRNYSHQEVTRNLSGWHQDATRMSNTTLLESDSHLRNPHPIAQSYRNNNLNVYEMPEPHEINDLYQYQLQLQQQEYLANLFPSEHVPYSSFTHEIRHINQRNDFVIEQQQSIQQNAMPVQFTNQMNLNLDRNYQNSPLYRPQLPDSANDRLVASLIEPYVPDLYLDQSNIRSICTNSADENIDYKQIAAFTKFLERENAL